MLKNFLIYLPLIIILCLIVILLLFQRRRNIENERLNRLRGTYIILYVNGEINFLRCSNCTKSKSNGSTTRYSFTFMNFNSTALLELELDQPALRKRIGTKKALKAKLKEEKRRQREVFHSFNKLFKDE